MSKAFRKIYNGKSRHIALRHEYVRQMISNGIVTVIYVKSRTNLVDPLTKGLSRDMVKSTSYEMGLKLSWLILTIGTLPLSLLNNFKGLIGNNKLL